MNDTYKRTLGYMLIPHHADISKSAFDSVDTLLAYLEANKDAVGFKGGFTVERCEIVTEVN